MLAAALVAGSAAERDSVADDGQFQGRGHRELAVYDAAIPMTAPPKQAAASAPRSPIARAPWALKAGAAYCDADLQLMPSRCITSN